MMVAIGKNKKDENSKPGMYENLCEMEIQYYTMEWVMCCLMPNWATFQLLVRKDMDVNEHERLSNITLGHKLK